MLLGILFTHRKAPVKVREEIFNIFKEKFEKEYPFIKEKVLLATCYRVEGYFFIDKNKKDETIKEFVPSNLIQYAEILTLPSQIFEHLVLVATGSDSPAIGEPEVQGQVKRCYMEAKKKGWVSKYLGKTFEKILSLSKKIREETELQKGSLSIPAIVSMYIKELNEDIKNLNVLLVGTGEMGIAISRYLVKNKIPFKIATKNEERKKFLEEHAHLDVILYNEKTLPLLIREYEAVIFATNSKNPLIYPHHIKESNNPKVIIDLGFPENVSKEVKKLSKIIYHGIDEFKEIIEKRVKEKEEISSYVKLKARKEGKEFEKRILREEKIIEVLNFVDKKVNEIIKKNGKDNQINYEKLKKFLIYPVLKSLRSGKPVEEFIDKWLKK